MHDLRLFRACDDAAKHFSKHQSDDVLVVCADTSRHLYVNGEEVEIPWFAAPMPLRPQAQEAPYLDMTPVEVQLGRWNQEDEEFVSSKTMSMEDFFSLSALIERITSH